MIIRLLFATLAQRLDARKERNMRFKDLLGGTNVLRCYLGSGDTDTKLISGVWDVYLWKWLLDSLSSIAGVKSNKYQ